MILDSYITTNPDKHAVFCDNNTAYYVSNGYEQLNTRDFNKAKKQYNDFVEDIKNMKI